MEPPLLDQQVDDTAVVALSIEALGCDRAGSGAHRRESIAVRQGVLERGGQSSAARLDEPARRSVIDDVGCTAQVGDDDGQAGGHRLHRGDTEAFGPAGQDEQIRMPVEVTQQRGVRRGAVDTNARLGGDGRGGDKIQFGPVSELPVKDVEELRAAFPIKICADEQQPQRHL